MGGAGGWEGLRGLHKSLSTLSLPGGANPTQERTFGLWHRTDDTRLALCFSFLFFFFIPESEGRSDRKDGGMKQEGRIRRRRSRVRCWTERRGCISGRNVSYTRSHWHTQTHTGIPTRTHRTYINYKKSKAHTHDHVGLTQEGKKWHSDACPSVVLVPSHRWWRQLTPSPCTVLSFFKLRKKEKMSLRETYNDKRKKRGRKRTLRWYKNKVIWWTSLPWRLAPQ